MVTKNEIKTQITGINSVLDSQAKGFCNDNAEKYLFFECGKLHYMAIEYAKATGTLSDKGIEILEDFDIIEDVEQFVLAIQFLLFRHRDVTCKSASEIKEILKNDEMISEGGKILTI